MRAQFSRAVVQLNRKVTAWGQNGGWCISFLIRENKGHAQFVLSRRPFRTNAEDPCMTPQPCTHLMHAVFNFRELGEWTDIEKQWRAVIAPCKWPPFCVNPQHTTTWADTRSTLQEILGKLWEDSLFKKQEVVNSCVKPERTSLIVNLRKTLTRCNQSLHRAALELKWENRFRWDKSLFLND